MMEGPPAVMATENSREPCWVGPRPAQYRSCRRVRGGD